MTNRIDDQTNKAIDRMIEDRQKDQQKVATQRDFANKLETQKATEKKVTQNVEVDKRGRQLATKNQTKSNAAVKKAETSPTKAQTPTNAAPKKSQPSTSAKQPASQTQKSQTKKADEKEETKKSGNAQAKEDKKRSDLKLDSAVKKKSETKDDDGGAKESEAFFQQAVILGSQAPQQASGAQASAGPSIPQAVIDQLVDRIYSSTSTEGLKELTIELRDGVLAGAHIHVSASNGKVKLQFSSDDPKTKTLLRNSKGAIAKRLEEKNLTLSEFVVD